MLFLGVLIIPGLRRDSETETEPPATSLAPAATPTSTTTTSTTTTTSPTIVLGNPQTTSTSDVIGVGPDFIPGTLSVLVGQAEPHLLMFTIGTEVVVHDITRNTTGPAVRFDAARSQYAFIDPAFRLHMRSTDSPGDQVTPDEAIALSVRSFAWSSDEPGRIAWVAFNSGGPILIEGGTDGKQDVGRPGDVDLVGFDSTGFYVFGGRTATLGQAWLRKLTPNLTHVGEVPADVIHIGSDGLVVVGQVQPGEGNRPVAFDWYLTDQDLLPLDPIPGPARAIAITSNHGSPRAVAFLTGDGGSSSIEVYRTGVEQTQTIDLGEVRAWDIQWSDDDRYLVVSGTDEGGRGHLVQIVEAATGKTTEVLFDDWVQGAQLISPRPSANSGGLEVPDVRGLVLADALTVLGEAGIVGSVIDFDSHDEDAVVRAQEPGAGQRIPVGSVVGLRTLTAARLGCDGSVSGSPIIDVPGTFGGVTLAGLSDTTPVTHGDLEPDSNGRRFAVELGTQLNAGSAPVWIVFPSRRPGEGAGLLFDRSVFRSDGRYLMAETSQAVELARCSTEEPTQYIGGIVVEGPRCIDIWIYEESLRADPTMIRVGIDTGC